MEKLWALIFDVCRVSTGDPVAAWREHVAKTKARRDQLNAWELESVPAAERERHRPDHRPGRRRQLGRRFLGG